MASKTHLTIACAFLLAASLSVAAEDGPFDAEQTYKATCFACHGTGAAHSPEVGDQIEWEIRMEKGMDAIMVNVMNGINAMPAKGLCMTCSADDLQEIVNYMVAK